MDAILSFVRKYISFIIPAAILLVALLLLLPLSMVRGSLKEDLEKSARVGSRVSSLLDSAPSKEQADVEAAYQAEHVAEVKQVDNLAIQTTQRDLIGSRLANYILPKPAEANPRLFEQFGQEYRKAVRSLLDSMGALDAPSESEIQAELAKMSPGSTNKRNVYGGRRGKAASKDNSDDAVVDALCQERAASVPVYASPDAFSWYDYWDTFEFNGVNDAVDDCWYSEISYWVYKDIVDTVNAINAGSGSVMTSDVKRLIGVRFSTYADYPGGKRAQVKFANDWPDYVIDYTPGVFGVLPWTARKCDKNIDVIQFSTAVLINARAIPDFLNELGSAKTHTFSGFRGSKEEQTFQHNQITVLQYWQEAIDPLSEVHDNYRYGDDPVVRLDLVCEYIFNRDGYEKIKPDSIKKYLEQAEED